MPTLAALEPIDPGSPGKMPQPDRKESQESAQQQTGAVAAMQQIACMVMMGAAAASGDPMMMMMAMQQCAQAEATRKSGEENDEGGKKLSEGEPAKGPSMKVPAFQAPSNSAKDEKLLPGLEAPPKVAETEPARLPDPVVTPIDVPPFIAPVKAEPEAKEEVAANAPVVPETSLPKKIDRAQIGYDESGKAGAAPTPERALGTGTSVATSKVSDAAKAEDAALRAGIGNARLEKIEGRLATKSPQGFGAAGDGGGARDGGADNGGGGGSLDALMSVLHPSGGESRAAGEMVTLGAGTAAEGDFPNLFEYASYRYRKAARVEKIIRARGQAPKTVALLREE